MKKFAKETISISSKDWKGESIFTFIKFIDEIMTRLFTNYSGNMFISEDDMNYDAEDFMINASKLYYGIMLEAHSIEPNTTEVLEPSIDISLERTIIRIIVTGYDSNYKTRYTMSEIDIEMSKTGINAIIAVSTPINGEDNINAIEERLNSIGNSIMRDSNFDAIKNSIKNNFNSLEDELTIF